MLNFLLGANRPGAKRLGGRNDQGRNDLGRNAAGAKRLGGELDLGRNDPDSNPLTVFSNLFETMQMFSAWSEDVHLISFAIPRFVLTLLQHFKSK